MLTCMICFSSSQITSRSNGIFYILKKKKNDFFSVSQVKQAVTHTTPIILCFFFLKKIIIQYLLILYNKKLYPSRHNFNYFCNISLSTLRNYSKLFASFAPSILRLPDISSHVYLHLTKSRYIK